MPVWRPGHSATCSVAPDVGTSHAGAITPQSHRGKGARVASQVVVFNAGVNADGRRKVLGYAVGDSQNQDFWSEFLRTLRDRGPGGT